MADNYIDALPHIQAILRDISNDEKLTLFDHASASESAVNTLEKEISAIISTGHKISLIMIGLKDGSGISYRSQEIMCYQSTIKAIYVGSLLDERPELFEKHKEEIRKTIELSDNDTYAYLRDLYGNEPLLRWCKDCNIDEGFVRTYYTRDRSAKELCILWTRMYAFLESEKAPTELKTYLSHSACSSASEVLSDRCFVQSKAGWENGLPDHAAYSKDMTYPDHLTDKDPSNDECAINDSGVIYTENGPYLFVIFSDLPYGVYAGNAPKNPLNGITEALYEIYQSFYPHL